MRVSVAMARIAKKKFISKYYDPEYINGVGISLVGIRDTSASHDDGRDYCLVVLLRKKLPLNTVIPSLLDGVRIFFNVVGEIRAQ
ncbi:hypothetical protein KJ885_04600 [Patescibacteria group bacterium]|nr:hypothetical protein [Patescibacteria group bacterium]